MITKHQILVFKRSADTLFELKDFTSATILYFKTLFAIHDFVLEDKIGQSPKDHSERFRFLEIHFAQLYRELDKEFSTYRDTYSKIIDKDTCLRIKKLVDHDLEQYNIEK